MSFFGQTQGSANTFRFVTINPTLLAGIFNAQTALATASTLPTVPQARASDPAVIAPWLLDENQQTLARGINSVRQQTQFIDLTASTVEAAGDDRDAEATFALFNALSDLRTLAQYASEERTLESELDRLSDTFELGLGQVQDFLAQRKLDKLDLIFSSRKSSVTSTATVGRNSNSYSGSVIQRAGRTDAIEGLVGTEVFSISLTKAGRTDVVDVNLADITGDLSIDAVVELINARISSIKLVDEFGNPELDEDGAPILGDDGLPVDRYLTRFEVRSDENFDFLLGVDGISTEQVSLSASGDPSVYVASTFDSIVTDTADFGRVNEFTATATGFTAAKRTDISAGSEALTELADSVAADSGRDTNDDPVDPVQLATRTDAIAVDSQGFTYLVSTSSGDVGTQLGTGQDDVFLTKLDSQGDIVFQRLLGTEGSSQGFAITVDASDNVIIAGQTTGRVDALDALDGGDSFIVKYTSSGTEVFRSQVDTVVTDAALSLTTNAAGDIFVGGYASGAVNNTTTASGERDALVLRLDSQTGAIGDVALFGTAGQDSVKALTIGSDGNLLAAVEEDGRGSLVKLDASSLSTELSRADLGALGGGSLSGIALTSGAGPNRIVVSGTTGNAGINGGTQVNAKSAGLDAFVTTFEDTGATLQAQLTRFIGTDASDGSNGIAVSGDDIYVTGRTGDTLPGQTRQGARDGFVARIDAQSGSLDSLSQFGAFGGQSNSVGIAVSSAGESVLSRLGLRSGAIGDTQDRTLGTQTSVTDGQFFFVAVNGRAPRRITVDADDTFRQVAARINALSLRSLKAEVSGDSLKIEALNDARVDILAGPEGSDALVRLGIEPQSILPSDRLFELNDTRPPEEQLGGTFALGLEASFNLRDKTTAKFVATKIDNAISTVQRAFRSLTFDPIAFQLQEQARFQGGTVPTRLTNQLANFQSALARLQTGSQASTSFII
ncbi:MAG: hypothetical protein AAF607_16070 [Pseudomonadota bacterium]